MAERGQKQELGRGSNRARRCQRGLEVDIKSCTNLHSTDQNGLCCGCSKTAGRRSVCWVVAVVITLQRCHKGCYCGSAALTGPDDQRRVQQPPPPACLRVISWRGRRRGWCNENAYESGMGQTYIYVVHCTHTDSRGVNGRWASIACSLIHLKKRPESHIPRLRRRRERAGLDRD